MFVGRFGVGEPRGKGASGALLGELEGGCNAGWEGMNLRGIERIGELTC